MAAGVGRRRPAITRPGRRTPEPAVQELSPNSFHPLYCAGLCWSGFAPEFRAAPMKSAIPPRFSPASTRSPDGSSSFDVTIDETVQFGTLQITPRVCLTRPQTEAPLTEGFVEVDEIESAKETKRVFSGWMFAASPGLHGIEHPVYDVWLKDCKGGETWSPRRRGAAERQCAAAGQCPGRACAKSRAAPSRAPSRRRSRKSPRWRRRRPTPNRSRRWWSRARRPSTSRRGSLLPRPKNPQAARRPRRCRRRSRSARPRDRWRRQSGCDAGRRRARRRGGRGAAVAAEETQAEEAQAQAADAGRGAHAAGAAARGGPVRPVLTFAFGAASSDCATSGNQDSPRLF